MSLFVGQALADIETRNGRGRKIAPVLLIARDEQTGETISYYDLTERGQLLALRAALDHVLADSGR